MAELGLVELRKKTALIDRLWNGKRPVTDSEIDDLLREARLEDKKVLYYQTSIILLLFNQLYYSEVTKYK